MRCISSIHAFVKDRYFEPRFRAPDANVTAELGFGGLAPPLPPHTMQDWRWYRDWLTRIRPVSMQRRAECAQQPTIGDCIYASKADRTIHRARPQLPSPDPSRAPNDYDQLLDRTVLSPNGKKSGYWEWDRDEIARENAFTPPAPRTPELFTPSPVPAEGSLEMLMWTSLGAAAHAERSRRRRTPSEVPEYLRPAGSGMDQEEVVDFVPRFRALPYEYQQQVWAAVHFRGTSWPTALEKAEEQYKRSRLLPTQRAVYDEVKVLQQRAKQLLENVEKEHTDRVYDFQISAAKISGVIHEVDNALQFLHPHGEEIMLLEDDSWLDGVHFWLAVVELIEEHSLDDQGIELGLRVQAVHNLWRLRRIKNARMIVNDTAKWLAVVGDREKELRGIYVRGDFWSVAVAEWERCLLAGEAGRPTLTDEGTAEMSRRHLARLFQDD